MSRPIISKSDSQPMNIFEYKYPPGNMNPVEKKIVTKNICVDSIFRQFYHKTKSSSFTFALPEIINNVISMKVTSVEFPNCWYTFDSKTRSNEFTITLYNTPTPIDISGTYPPFMQYTIKIPEGNYRSDVFSNVINNMFSNIRGGLEFIYFNVNENNSRCSFRSKAYGDDTSNIFTNTNLFELDPSNNFYFTLDFALEGDQDRPLYQTAGWMMGFRQPSYTVNYSTEPISDLYSAPFITGTENAKDYNWYLESESSYGSSVENYLYLEIDDFHKNFITNSVVGSSIRGNYLGNNIIGRISVVSGMYTTITNTASDKVFKKREYFGPVKIEKFQVRLLNRFGEPVQMNENDFSFTVELEQIYS